MPIAKILQFPPRRTIVDLCADHTREEDEALLRVIQGFEDRGRTVTFDEPKAEPAPQPVVSEYLTRPLRSEAEVRALREPRQPKVKGLLDLIAEQTGIDAAFRNLMGGK